MGGVGTACCSVFEKDCVVAEEKTVRSRCLHADVSSDPATAARQVWRENRCGRDHLLHEHNRHVPTATEADRGIDTANCRHDVVQGRA